MKFTTMISLTVILVGLIGCSDSASGVPIVKAWVMGDGVWQDFYRQLGDKFNQEHQDMQVKIEFIPWNQGHDKLILAAVSGTGPDVATDGGRWTTELAAMDALQPLDDFINDDYKKDFVPAAWETTQWKGQTWGIPQGFTTTGLFYRTDWLKETGYSAPPNTWAEFRDVAKKMTQDGRYGFGLVGDNSMETTMFWTPFLWQAGGELLSPDHKKAAFNSPAGVEALQFYVDLYRTDKSAPEGALSTKRNDSQAMFTNGLAGMTTSGPWFFGEIKKNKPDLPYAVAPYPVGKKAANLGTTDHFIMLKSAKDKQAAWKWIDYATNKENAQAWTQAAGFIPYRKSGLEDASLTVDPNYKMLIDEAKNSRAYPTLPEWPQIDELIANAVQEALAGKKTPKEALDDAAKQADAILAGAQ
ncbi:MAG: extracellular solute-binding protein [Tumebacillaceae bacterium]